jgi:tetratricopeptide (TPR) repeat protein
MEQAKLAIEKAPTAQRKAEIANDFAHIYLDYNFIERTSYFYPFIAEAAKTGSVVDDIALRALDARLKSASAADNINAEEIRVILQEAEKHHHVIAQVDACLALAAVGDSKHAINHLKNMRKKQNASTSILRALLNVYKQSNDANNAERIEARIAVLEQRLPRDTAEKLSKKNQSAEAIFVNYTDESEFIKSIDQAVEERDFNKAIDLYTQLLSHETIRTKNPARTYQNRAGFYMAIENYVRAAEDYAKALEIGKLNLSSENIVRHNYARALFSIKDYRGVVEQLELLLPAKAGWECRQRLLCWKARNQIGLDFEGVVSGTTSFGVFVSIAELGVDGLVRLSEVPGFWKHDYERRQFVETGGQVLKLGSRLQVRLLSVAPSKGRADFKAIKIF